MAFFARRALEIVLVLALFVSLSAVVTWPFVLHLGDHLRDNGDSYEYAWAIGFGAYQLLHAPLHLFDGNIFYPFPLSLAYSDSIVPNIVFGTPIVIFTGNPVLALNILILLTFALAGFGMYLYVRNRTGSSAAGVVAGILYGFNPYLSGHVAQIPNVSIEWAPFALWCFDRYLKHGRYRWAAGFVATSVLQVLVSFYYAFILGIGIALYVIIQLFRERWSWARPRWIVPLLGFGALGGLVLVPLVEPYFQLEHSFGLHRTIGEATYYSAWPANYLAPTSVLRIAVISPLVQLVHKIWPNIVFSASERQSYPGALIVLLSVVALARYRPRRILSPLLMVVVGLLLSFGPVFHPSAGVTLTLPFPMPYKVLFDYLPGFTALRVPSRFAALFIFGLAILAGDGFASLITTHRARSNSGRDTRLRLSSPVLFSLGVGCIAIGEGLTAFPSTPVYVNATLPPVYHWLASQPVPSPVVELPIDDDAFHQSPRSYYSTYHHQPLVNGFRSFVPPGYSELAQVLNTFPAPIALRDLQQLGVRYVIVHRAELKAPLSISDTPVVRRVRAFGADDVYEIRGSSASSITMSALPPTCLSELGGIGDLQVVLRSPGDVNVIVFPPADHTVRFDLSWKSTRGFESQEMVNVPIAAAVLPSPTTLTLPFHVPTTSGIYSLVIAVDPMSNVQGQLSLPAIPVGGVQQPIGTGATPRLVLADLLSRRPKVTSGLEYQLIWKLDGQPRNSVSVFADAYDREGHYWSFPGRSEETFQQPSTCGGLLLDARRLHLDPKTPPGQYWFEAGLHDQKTGSRVPFIGPDGKTTDHVVVGSFWIRPPNVYAPGTLSPGDAQQRVTFDDSITLDGWSILNQWNENHTVKVTARWIVRRLINRDYTVFVHLSDSSGKVVAQFDGQPNGGIYPTSAWLPGETMIETYRVSAPSELPPGTYTVSAGWYDLKTMQRLLVSGGGETHGRDEITLGVIHR